MAQLYLIDSGYMIHQGLGEMVYRAWPDFSSEVHGIADSVQAFPGDWQQQIAIRQSFWFWVPGQALFFQRNSEEHHLIAAARALFAPERWDEILEAIEEQGNFERACDKLKVEKCRKLINKAETKGQITLAERDLLFTVFA